MHDQVKDVGPLMARAGLLLVSVHCSPLAGMVVTALPFAVPHVALTWVVGVALPAALATTALEGLTTTVAIVELPQVLPERVVGVPVTVKRYDGAIHGFLGSPDDAQDSHAFGVRALRQAFTP